MNKIRKIINFYTEGLSLKDKSIFINRLKKFKSEVPGFYKDFINLDHSRVLSDIQRIYGVDASSAKKAIFSYPQFAGKDHSRVLSDIQRIYGVDASSAKKAIFSSSSFSGLDHSRVLSDIQRIYGVDASSAKKAILSYPSFAGLDHSNIMKTNLRLGKLFGLTEEFIKQKSFENRSLNIQNPYKKTAFIDVLKKVGFDSKIFTNLENKINERYFKQNKRYPTAKEMLELKSESIFSWLNSKSTEKKYSPFIEFNEMPKDMQKKIQKVKERVNEISKQTRYTLPGIREGTVKKYYKGPTSTKLEEYLKKGKFFAPKHLSGKKK
ncbi:MAG: hypothetical protein PHX47_03535 [Candidatus ainarchaeum sp.]|nr:hypothetical protein [Candidatus ainarchaeum sp.]